MTNTVLYRRYRPKAFKEVLGQNHVVKAIEGAIKNNSFAHAYLFAGSRGTGKTSIARIFAAEIGVSANDLYEIDAASNRGIDDVRELRDSVVSMPMESPYKVYIIDEVHMLTKEAFNALLKTLEEPPSHVIFMLATTEAHKLPDTIISRCQHFTFRQPTQELLKKTVMNIAKKEGYSIDTRSADLVALLGEGSFRDTIGMFQKVVSAIQGTDITEAEVVSITGAPRSETVNTLVDTIGYRRSESALEIIHKEVKKGTDILIILSLMLQKLRTILLLRFSAGLADEISEEVSEDDLAYLLERAKDKEFFIDAAVLNRLLEAHEQTAYAAVSELPLELVMIELAKEENEKETK